MALNAVGWLQNSLGLDVTGEWGQIVHLSVGGICYVTDKKALRNFQENPLFSRILKDTMKKSEDGAVVIDRDGTTFRYVLNFMRTGQLHLPDEFQEWDQLLDDCIFYQMKTLEDAVRNHKGYKKREWKSLLPTAIYLTWNVETKNVQLVPGNLPHLQIPEDGKFLMYQNRQITSVEEAVFVFLSAYFMHVEHWEKQQDGQGQTVHHIYFTVKSK